MISERVFVFLARAVVMCTAMPAHECAHGLAASLLGDDTARKKGRLTLNPLAHLDPFGSLLLLFAGFGWAKPVPVNARNFKNPKTGMALTALAGPASNILMAVAVTILFKLTVGILDQPALRESNVLYYTAVILINMAYANLYLAVFNLLPIPPLDGAKILGGILPKRAYFIMLRYERYIAFAVIFLAFAGAFSDVLKVVVDNLYIAIDLLTYPIDLIFM